MSHETLLFFFLTLFSIQFQAFFSMMEMAAVSFNKVRLQYYVSKGVKKAVWLNSLLNHPTRLFGTTLLCVNAALQFGSECSRRLYSSMGMNPDWAPITQIILVVIFAELAPMFAARSYAENVALLGIRVLYGFSLLMRPFVWLIEMLFKVIHVVFKTNPRKHSFLTKEDLQRAIEARGEGNGSAASIEFDYWIASLFSTKDKVAKDFMIPLAEVDMIPSTATVRQVKEKMRQRYHHYFPVFKGNRSHIVGVISPRDLLRCLDDEKIAHHLKAPWFIPIKSSLFQIVREFRWNNQEIAMVIDEKANAIGMITLDHTIAEILPETRTDSIMTKTSLDKAHILLDRSFAGSALIRDISEQYQINLEGHSEDEDLETFMQHKLGHLPGLNERVIVNEFELKVIHSPLIGEKIINIRSL